MPRRIRLPGWAKIDGKDLTIDVDAAAKELKIKSVSLLVNEPFASRVVSLKEDDEDAGTGD